MSGQAGDTAAAPGLPANNLPPDNLPAGDCSRIDQLVEHWADRAPERIALSEAGVERSYAQLQADVLTAAAFLAARGVGDGDRVLILMENGLAAVTLLLAATRLGAWAVPVNARLTAREVAAIRDHAEPRLTLYTLHSSAEARTHAEGDGAQEATELGALGVAWRPEDVSGEPEAAASAGRGRVAALIYTSGTTGAPKGVMLTQGNLLFVAEETSRLRQLTSDDRVYLVLPISHVYGLAAVMICNFFRGVRVDLVARFAPEAVARALAEDGISVFSGVPTMYAQLLNLAAKRGAPLAAPRLRYISIGGAALDMTLKHGVEAMFGLPLLNGYGLTETSPTVCTTGNGEWRDDDAVGTLLPGVEIQIVDKEARPLPSGEIGELWVRGPLVMKGYYRDPEGSARVLTPEGWFRTGDLARRAAGGQLYIVGRLKEIIKHSGFTVYPTEIESVLAAHPDIAVAAVVGRKSRDAEKGDNEEILAFLMPRPGQAPDPADLQAWARERLAPYKRPSRYILRQTLPMTAAGKVLRHKLGLGDDG